MQIDAAIIGVVVSVIISLLGVAVWLGTISAKVNFNKENISTLFDKFSNYQKENKTDHERILTKIESLRNSDLRH